MEGSREVVRDIDFYNLDMIIAIGFRVRSSTGTKFRIWANEKLQEIRLSEKFFYQKIKDIYMTSIDYDPKDEKTIEFFKIVQNKLLWAVSSQTAAELVHNRACHTPEVESPLFYMPHPRG